MEEDKELKDAIEACAKIVAEKCGKLPFMIVISKANIKFESQAQKEKGIATGTASYMYLSRPPLKRNGLSKLLIDTSKVALRHAEKNIEETSGKSP